MLFRSWTVNLITAEMKAKVEQAERDIIDGKIKVQDYMEANICSP